jgi:hypothetical protein
LTGSGELLEFVGGFGWGEVCVVDYGYRSPGRELLVDGFDAGTAGAAGFAALVTLNGHLDAGLEADVMEGDAGGPEAIEEHGEILFGGDYVVDDYADALGEEV